MSYKLRSPLLVTEGGSGHKILPAHSIPIGNGTGSFTLLTNGVTGQVLTATTGTVPSWGQVSLTAGVSGILPVDNGGTGASSLTDNSVLVGSGTSAVTALTVGTDGQVLLGATGADPAFATLTSTGGSITFTPGANTLNLETTGSASAGRLVISARKGSAGTINPGQVVYISGYDVGAGVPEVELAQADAAGTMPAVGICETTITNVATGTIVTFGQLGSQGTSGYSAGDTLYVDAAVAGDLTDTKPTGSTNLIQNIGVVARSHVSAGVIEVFGAGRSNDLPNIAQDNFWLGNASDVPTATSNLTVPIGGTGRASHTAYAVICGGTTSTAAQQSVASVGTSGQVLTSNGAGALPTFQDAAGGGITWNEETGTSATMAVDNGYIANNAGLVTFTLPDTVAVGEVVRVAGLGAGGWAIAQNAGDTIHFGDTDTTTGVGGSLASTNRYDAVELLCVVANTDFVVLSSVGNITIV